MLPLYELGKVNMVHFDPLLGEAITQISGLRLKLDKATIVNSELRTILIKVDILFLTNYYYLKDSRLSQRANDPGYSHVYYKNLIEFYFDFGNIQSILRMIKTLENKSNIDSYLLSLIGEPIEKISNKFSLYKHIVEASNTEILKLYIDATKDTNFQKP